MASLLCQYCYDPLDRLINQTRTGAPVNQRFYCKSRLATEIQGALQYSIVQHDELLLAQQRRDGDNLSSQLLSTDLKRSVLHSLEKTQQPQSFAYSPYGYRLSENGIITLPGFNGERQDLVTGHFLLGNGYRAFNPVLMRFNSSDTLSPFGKGGLNSYAYCLGDPLNRSDATGRYSIFARALASTTRRVKTIHGFSKIQSGIKTKDALIANDQMKALHKFYNSKSKDELYGIQYQRSRKKAESMAQVPGWDRVDGIMRVEFLDLISDPTTPRYYSPAKLDKMAEIYLTGDPRIDTYANTENQRFGREYRELWQHNVSELRYEIEFKHQDIYKKNFNTTKGKSYLIRNLD